MFYSGGGVGVDRVCVCLGGSVKRKIIKFSGDGVTGLVVVVVSSSKLCKKSEEIYMFRKKVIHSIICQVCVTSPGLLQFNRRLDREVRR